MKRMKKTLSLLLCLVLLAGWAPLCVETDAAALTAGDVNLDGKVTAEDARLALRNAVGLEALSAEKTLNADADRSGDISAADARLILRCAVGLETLAAPTENDLHRKELTGAEMDPYKSDDFRLVRLIYVTVGDADHAYLDNRFAVSFQTPDNYPEENLVNYVGLVYGEDNVPFAVLPDPDARAEGKFKFYTTHFSCVGIGEFTDHQLLDTWASRAAAQSVTRRISEEELVPGLSDIIIDGLKVNGLGKDQYAGAVVRSILSLDTRGEIITAAADGDTDGVKAKLANYAGEYFMGKVFKGEEDKFLNKSLGDNAAAVKQSVKDGKYAAAAKAIEDNILSNTQPMYNYARKVADLTDKLANIWTDDMMNEQYEKFRDMMEKEGRVSSEEWTAMYIKLRGAAVRLSSKEITSADIRAKFEQRMKNEDKIKKEHKELLRDAALWRSLGLLDTTYWEKVNGHYPTDVERLNSLRQARDMLKTLLTLNGKFQRGRGYQTDNDFLKDALVEWVRCGKAGRADFYQWLRSKGVYLPGSEPEETTTARPEDTTSSEGSDKDLETCDPQPGQWP